MYAAGDKIVYSNTGVCIVTEICTPNFSREERGRQYYKLQPVYSSETIFAPVDTKVFMRPIMTQTEAEALIGRISEIEAQPCTAGSTTMLRQQYEAFFRDHDCESCIRLMKGVWAKGQSGKKLGQTDQRYLKRAEDTLCNELAAALDIGPAQICTRVRSVIEHT